LTTAPIDSAQYARTVREDTAELASYVLSDPKPDQSPAFLSRQRSHSSRLNQEASASDVEDDEVQQSRQSETIVEATEPESSEPVMEAAVDGPSVLSNLLRKSPSQSRQNSAAADRRRSGEESRRGRRPSPAPWTDHQILSPTRPESAAHERSPLLANGASERSHQHGRDSDDTDDIDDTDDDLDVEGQKAQQQKPWFGRVKYFAHRVETGVGSTAKVVFNPTKWDRKAIWRNGVVAPFSCLPAVLVGGLLNILDALSYG
jgi:sulfate permease, SulP family